MRYIPVLIILFSFLLPACDKDPGPGGNAKVKGKVFAEYYNNTFTYFYGSGYVQDKDVYIIYGNDVLYGDRTKTNFNGAFEFRNLKKGNYTVYVYSKDSTFSTPAKYIPVTLNLTIKKANETIELPEIKIFE